MPAPTRRSKAERDLYYIDNTIPRVSDAVKVVKLDPPDRIKDHPQKLDCWNYLCNDLAGRQILSPSYFIPITILVDNIINYNEYLVSLEESGPLVPILGRDGDTIVGYKANPLFDMVKRIELAINKQCEKFGLNPRDAIYVTNPDLKTQLIEQKAVSDKKNITYFST